MPRPVLPLGSKAPWILAGVALALVTSGVLSSNREMIILGAAAGGLWVLAFPLTKVFLGSEQEAPEPEDRDVPAPGDES